MNAKVEASLGRDAGQCEHWTLKATDGSGRRALWLRFSALRTKNGFKQAAEIWAVLFERESGKDVVKAAFKQTHELSELVRVAGSGSPESSSYVSIPGVAELSSTRSRGAISTKGRRIEWDLAIRESELPLGRRLEMLPSALRRGPLRGASLCTEDEALRLSGTISIDGVRTDWKDASAMRSHFSSRKMLSSWAWSHCNTFVDESGNPAPLAFEGLIGQAKWLGPVNSPRWSSLYFHHAGREFKFNTFWQNLKIRNQVSLSGWEFRAEREDYVFQGSLRAEPRDFAGLTFEDTLGLPLYSANSELSDLVVAIYRRGKLEGSFNSRGTAGFEIVSSVRSPYVSLLI